MASLRRPVGREVTRRKFLTVGLGAGAGLMLLGGCGGSQSESASGEITLLTWAGPAEEEGFRGVIERYQKQNPDVKVRLEIVPPDGAYEKLDTRLAAGNGPDLARLQYQVIGRYSSQGALVDLSEYLDPNYGDAFIEAFWQSVQYEDKPYALPHHTDTFATFYNTDIFGKLGIEVPKSLEQSWTWDQFIEVARQLKKESNSQFAFAMNWQGEGAAYRWMPFLYQHGGQLLDDDMKTPQIDTSRGVETIAFNQSWFEEGLVPPSTSIKSGEEIETLFANGTMAMMLNGDWLMPFLKDNMQAGWDITYMPRDTEMASDLGGNCVAVTKDSENPEAAADFLKYLAGEEAMKYFVETAQFLPVRKSLTEQKLGYDYRPNEMQIFVEQATTIPEHMAAVQTLPAFSKINDVLADQLELAFKTGQSPEATAKNISNGINEAMG